MNCRRKIVFLVRCVEGVRVVLKRPQGVRLSEACLSWFYKGGMFCIGSHDSRVFGEKEKWEGVIGAYDLSSTVHLHTLLSDIIWHQKEFFKRKMEDEIAEAVSTFRLNGKKDDPFTLVRSFIEKIFG